MPEEKEHNRMVEEKYVAKAAGLRGQLSRRWAAYHKK